MARESQVSDLLGLFRLSCAFLKGLAEKHGNSATAGGILGHTFQPLKRMKKSQDDYG